MGLAILMVASALHHRELPLVRTGRQGLNQLHWLQAAMTLLNRGGACQLVAFLAASISFLYTAVQRRVRTFGSAPVG